MRLPAESLRVLKRRALAFLWPEAKAGPGAPPASAEPRLGSHCRLPECAEVVWKRSDRGRAQWFCGDEHRLTFRLRGEALDRALLDFELELEPARTRDERRSIAAHGNWLRELRRQYEPLGTSKTAQPEDGEISNLAWSLIRDASGRPLAPDRCPLCAGTGRRTRRLWFVNSRMLPRLSADQLLDAATQILEEWAVANHQPQAIERVHDEIDRLRRARARENH